MNFYRLSTLVTNLRSHCFGLSPVSLRCGDRGTPKQQRIDADKHLIESG